VSLRRARAPRGIAGALFAGLALSAFASGCGAPEVERGRLEVDGGAAIDPCPFNVQPNGACERPNLCCEERIAGAPAGRPKRECVCSNGRWLCRAGAVDAGAVDEAGAKARCQCRPGDEMRPSLRYFSCDG
jgi:hypothetical protein